MLKNRLKPDPGSTMTSAAKCACMGDLIHAVLLLFGATPISTANLPDRHFGRIPARAGKTLVWVDCPNQVTGVSSLRQLLARLESRERLVVLGWQFDTSIGSAINALNDMRLEVRAIPSDLPAQIAENKGYERLMGRIDFSRSQYLMLKQLSRTQYTKTSPELLVVTLENYVPLSPRETGLNEVERRKLQKEISRNSLGLIDYWAVDPDYDGQTFQPLWHNYRGNQSRGGRLSQAAAQAVLSLPPKSGPRRVCVRAVDRYGFEAEVVDTLADPIAAPAVQKER
jgi:adenine-specific DNA-methyltransferase